MKKINPLEVLQGEQGLEIRNAAIVYLHDVKKYTVETLATLTDLAVSTIKNYVRKFAHLLDYAKQIFLKGKNFIQAEKVKAYLCYIDKVTLEDGTIWCKIGQTTTTPEKRAKGFKWVVNGVTVRPAKTEVYYSVECKDATAMQNMEDCLRLGMTAIDSNGYLEKDRLDSWEEDYPQRILGNPFVKMGLEQFAI